MSWMERVLKVFVEGDEQERLAEKPTCSSATTRSCSPRRAPAAAKRIARELPGRGHHRPVRDPRRGGTIDTSKPRIDAEGATRAHPAYRRGARCRRAAPLPRPVHRADQGALAARRQARRRRAAPALGELHLRRPRRRRGDREDRGAAVRALDGAPALRGAARDARCARSSGAATPDGCRARSCCRRRVHGRVLRREGHRRRRARRSGELGVKILERRAEGEDARRRGERAEGRAREAAAGGWPPSTRCGGSGSARSSGRATTSPPA